MKCTLWVKIGYATKVEELMQERESWMTVVWNLFIHLETKALIWLVLAHKVLPVGKWEISADKGDVSYANEMLSLWITCLSCAPSPDLDDLMCHKLQGTDQDDIYRHSLVDCLGLHWWQNCSNFFRLPCFAYIWYVDVKKFDDLPRTGLHCSPSSTQD